MAKQTDKTSPARGPAKPKQQPQSSSRIRSAVASAGPAGLVRRITRQRRVTFTVLGLRIRCRSPRRDVRHLRAGRAAVGLPLRLRPDPAVGPGHLPLGEPEGPVDQARSTPRAYPSYEFARTLDEDTPSPLPDVPGAPSWDAYLEYGQRRLQQTGLDTKMVTLSVWVGPNPNRRVQEELIRGVEHPLPETVAVIEEILRVTNIVKGSGWPTGRAAGHGVPDAPVAVDGCAAPMHAGAPAVGGSRTTSRASSLGGSGSTTR